MVKARTFRWRLFVSSGVSALVSVLISQLHILSINQSGGTSSSLIAWQRSRLGVGRSLNDLPRILPAGCGSVGYCWYCSVTGDHNLQYHIWLFLFPFYVKVFNCITGRMGSVLLIGLHCRVHWRLTRVQFLSIWYQNFLFYCEILLFSSQELF